MLTKCASLSQIGAFLLMVMNAIQAVTGSLHTWLILSLVIAVGVSASLSFLVRRNRRKASLSHEDAATVGQSDFVVADMTANYAVDRLREVKLRRVDDLLNEGRFLVAQPVPVTATNEYVDLWRELVRRWREEVTAYLQNTLHSQDFANEFLDTTGVQVANDVQSHYRIWADLSNLNAYLRNLVAIQRTLRRTDWPVA